MGFLDWLVQRWLQRTRAEEAKVVVGYDEERIWCRAPNRPEESVVWSKLASVAIKTTDAGPFSSDFFWVLRADGDQSIVFPGGATGSKDLLSRLQQLPEFDNEAVISAASSTDHRVFECWRREGGTSSGRSPTS